MDFNKEINMERQIKVIVTSKDTGDKLSDKGLVSFQKIKDEEVDIKLDTTKQYQTILGFGGALTEAAAYTLSKMSEDRRKEVIESYFHQENGIGYSLGRVHIHSCDFSLGNYTYVQDDDVELKTFDIARDRKWVLPLIKDAEKVRGEKLELLASPWSPPAWMKTNKEMNRGGKLLPQYRDTWAKYYTKFIKAYEQEGINIWGISVQNEPAAVQTWDSCIYTAEEERDFVRDNLGPIMHQEGHQDVKVLIWDHNRDIMIERASTVLLDKEAAKYVWGTGFHWYVSEAFENVGKVHELFPDKHLLFTEGCQEGGVKLGAWFTGERYGRNMIGDLNNWAEGYIDWNIVLDETGGPNHVNNLCDAPIIADTRTNKLHYNSSYYYIGHFSKFIKPGAVRIGLSSNNPKIQSTAFLNKDGSIVVVAMNEKDEDISFSLGLKDMSVSLELKPHSIATYII
jgi:glucosylceramidase